MITQNEKIHDMVILDLVIMDEFSEPFHYASQPTIIHKKPLFSNELNMDFNEVIQSDPLSIEYVFGSKLAMKMEMHHREDGYTYVTNLMVKLSLSSINERF